MLVNCVCCGKDVERKPYQVSRAKNSFCSKVCFYNHKNTRTRKECMQCGEIIEVPYKEASKNKFCSHKCSSLWHSKENHPAWNGGRSITKEGYIYRWSGEDRSKIEHRVIFEQYLGRPLEKDEIIHHKNGDRSDNRLENLELWTKNHPMGQRVEDKIKWAIEFLNKYGYKITK